MDHYNAKSFERKLNKQIGPCPGWLRPPLVFPDVSPYDGCMTVLLQVIIMMMMMIARPGLILSFVEEWDNSLTKWDRAFHLCLLSDNCQRLYQGN